MICICRRYICRNGSRMLSRRYHGVLGSIVAADTDLQGLASGVWVDASNELRDHKAVAPARESAQHRVEWSIGMELFDSRHRFSPNHFLFHLMSLTSSRFHYYLLPLTRPPPLRQIHNFRRPSRSHNRPDNILITLIHLLMFRKRGYQGKVSWSEMLFLLAPVADDRSMAGGGKDDGVLGTVVVDCGCGMGFCDHAGCADSVADVC